MSYSPDLPRLLRAMANGSDAKSKRHDVIFKAAAEELEASRERLKILDGISSALETRGYAHFTHGTGIGGFLDQLERIETAIKDYHYALDTRQHGGVAADRVVKIVETTLGLPWERGLEERSRAK